MGGFFSWMIIPSRPPGFFALVGSPRSRESSAACSWVLRSASMHGGCMSLMAIRWLQREVTPDPKRGHKKKQGNNKNQGTLHHLVVQLTTPATSCKQKGRRFGRNCHNPLGGTIWQSLLVPFPTLLAAPPPPGELPEIWMKHPRIHHQKIVGPFFLRRFL